eukprot:2222604-Rhodomonas_salina.3
MLPAARSLALPRTRASPPAPSSRESAHDQAEHAFCLRCVPPPSPHALTRCTPAPGTLRHRIPTCFKPALPYHSGWHCASIGCKCDFILPGARVTFTWQPCAGSGEGGPSSAHAWPWRACGCRAAPKTHVR